MAFLETSLVLHVGTDSLHRGEIAEISIFGKCCGVCSLRSIKKLREGQLVFRFLRADKCCSRSSLHQLLDKVTNLLVIGLGDIVFIFHLLDVLVVQVGFIRVFFREARSWWLHLSVWASYAIWIGSIRLLMESALELTSFRHGSAIDVLALSESALTCIFTNATHRSPLEWVNWSTLKKIFVWGCVFGGNGVERDSRFWVGH